jgi:hypothetical protein
LDITGRQRKIELLWTLWNEKEENACELVCGGRGVSRPLFIGQGREGEDMNEQE